MTGVSGRQRAREQKWAKHFCAPWTERAQDQRNDQWLRAAGAAYGRVEENGHARFGVGELGRLLSTDGAPDRNASRAISEAVRRGWLAPGSKARCLIVPGHTVQYGQGDTGRPCPEHQG